MSHVLGVTKPLTRIRASKSAARPHVASWPFQCCHGHALLLDRGEGSKAILAIHIDQGDLPSSGAATGKERTAISVLVTPPHLDPALNPPARWTLFELNFRHCGTHVTVSLRTAP
jgi:hypothetical protein